MRKGTLFLFLCNFTIVAKIPISEEQAYNIGQKIWHNECASSINGLTSWNEGEEFASLGIGHFIWYPEGNKGPFKESFPALVTYLKRNGKKIPQWLDVSIKTGCPWKNREQFFKEFNSIKMQDLRTFLSSSIDLQTNFMIQRFYKTLPHLLAAATPNKRSAILQQFNRIARKPGGLYPLIDYVNFKGEGIKPTESYQGVRWGLLQVLEQMKGIGSDNDALKEFSKAAQTVLEKRIAHAPPERNEKRWLPGWINRINTYTINQ